MLDSKDSGMRMTSSHRISFSIIDILDPKKFNSKRVNELSIAKEKFSVPNAEGPSLESDASADEDHGNNRTKTGKENSNMNYKNV